MLKFYKGYSVLVGFEPIASIMPLPIARSMQHHKFVAVCSTSGKDDDCEWRILDFLPLNPTSPLTVMALLRGGSVAGRVRDKRLRGDKWIESRVARVECQESLLLEESRANEVIDVHNHSWMEDRLDLSLFPTRNDCDSYAESLLKALNDSKGG